MRLRTAGWGVGLALGGALVGAAWGQTAVTPAEPVPAAPPPVVAQTQGKAAEKVMTPEEVKALFASVDTTMGFASKDSGLPAVVNVKRAVLGRAEVNAYLVKNFDEDESAKRLQRSEIVMKKFGLLSRDFDLRPFLLSLLTEQVAGFYDAKTKVVNLLNWVPVEDQKPVLAHELTHALQDKQVGLEQWSSNGFKGVSKTAAEDNARVRVDELETARQAVTEGQAMVVFVDYSLKDTGKTLVDLPAMGDRMREAAADPSGSPILARAPLVLQRSLLFPYGDGLGFEQAVLVGEGKTAAFAGVLASPPGSSFEIMNPAAFMAHTPVPVLRVPDVHRVLDAEYEPYDVGVMGELDVEMLTATFAGEDVARQLETQWAGGVYYAAQRKSATVAERKTTGSLGLVYYSQWKSAVAARTFAEVYRRELGKKYDRLTERKADEMSGDEEVYSTGEGDVLLAVSGESVFVSEGFRLAQARTLGEAFQGVQATGPVQEAGVTPRGELGLGVVRELAGFGAMRGGLGAAATGYTLSLDHCSGLAAGVRH